MAGSEARTNRAPDCDPVRIMSLRVGAKGILRRFAGLCVLCTAACLVGTCGPVASEGDDAEDPAPTQAQAAEPEVPIYRYKVVKTYPHDARAFTQGLVYEAGFVYEGTGLYGQSALTQRELTTGKLVRRERLPRQYFGEGITIFGDKIIQLTWKSRTGFVYDKETFRLLGEFRYETQGWGITHNDRQLILSDGTATLRFLDPNTYAETGRIAVRDKSRAVKGLNELEFIDGKIYANIWTTDFIAIIAPETGRITGWLDLTDLWPTSAPRPSDYALNGIAYIPQAKHLLVTGKLWPKLYEIELIESP